MTARHIQTVCQRLVLEIGYASDIGASGLTTAIREALERGGVLEEGEVVYIRAEAPEERYCHTDVWAPELPSWTEEHSGLPLARVISVLVDQKIKCHTDCGCGHIVPAGQYAYQWYQLDRSAQSTARMYASEECARTAVGIHDVASERLGECRACNEEEEVVIVEGIEEGVQEARAWVQGDIPKVGVDSCHNCCSPLPNSCTCEGDFCQCTHKEERHPNW